MFRQKHQNEHVYRKFPFIPGKLALAVTFEHYSRALNLFINVFWAFVNLTLGALPEMQG
jgi:hypothetical protein